MAEQPLHMLIVDDDEVNRMLITRATEGLPTQLELISANDGVEALEILRSKEMQDLLSKSLVVLLDLRMPRMGGLEFLHELRGDPLLYDVVVFVFTTSADERDIKKAYALNAAGYFVRPVEYPEFEAMMKTLIEFCAFTQLPTRELRASSPV